MSAVQLLMVSGWATDRPVWCDVTAAFDATAEICHLDWQDALDGDWPEPWQEPDADTKRVGIGWSLGGLLLLEAALDDRVKLDHLILISATAKMCAEADYPGADLRAIRAMRLRLKREPEALLTDFFGQCLQPQADTALIPPLVQTALAMDRLHLDRGLEALAKRDLRGRLQRLEIPVTVIHGEGDAIVPVENGRYLADALPNARWHALAEHNHFLPMCAQQTLITIIRETINGY